MKDAADGAESKEPQNEDDSKFPNGALKEILNKIEEAKKGKKGKKSPLGYTCMGANMILIHMYHERRRCVDVVSDESTGVEIQMPQMPEN